MDKILLLKATSEFWRPTDRTCHEICHCLALQRPTISCSQRLPGVRMRTMHYSFFSRLNYRTSASDKEEETVGLWKGKLELLVTCWKWKQIRLSLSLINHFREEWKSRLRFKQSLLSACNVHAIVVIVLDASGTRKIHYLSTTKHSNYAPLCQYPSFKKCIEHWNEIFSPRVPLGQHD